MFGKSYHNNCPCNRKDEKIPTNRKQHITDHCSYRLFLSKARYFDTGNSFFIHICIEIIAQCARLKIVLPMINMTIKEYTSAVMKKIIIVILLAPILPIIIYYNTEQNFLSFISICITSTISILFCIYTLGLDQHERNTIKEVINKKIYHRQKNKS